MTKKNQLKSPEQIAREVFSEGMRRETSIQDLMVRAIEADRRQHAAIHTCVRKFSGSQVEEREQIALEATWNESGVEDARGTGSGTFEVLVYGRNVDTMRIRVQDVFDLRPSLVKSSRSFIEIRDGDRRDMLMVHGTVPTLLQKMREAEAEQEATEARDLISRG